MPKTKKASEFRGLSEVQKEFGKGSFVIKDITNTHGLSFKQFSETSEGIKPFLTKDFIVQEKVPFKYEFRVHALEGNPYYIKEKHRKMAPARVQEDILKFTQDAIKDMKAAGKQHHALDVVVTKGGRKAIIENNAASGYSESITSARRLKRLVRKGRLPLLGTSRQKMVGLVVGSAIAGLGTIGGIEAKKRGLLKRADKRELSTGAKIGIGVGGALLATNVLLAAKLPALGKNKGFVRGFAENIKFFGRMPYKTVKGTSPGAQIRKRLFGAKKIYSMKLGPGNVFERSHELATKEILSAKTGQPFGISSKRLHELKQYLSRPTVRGRKTRLVYPHEVGELGRLPELEKIKSNIARKYSGRATVELLEKSERGAASKGYEKVVGFSHFDPKQLALTGYEEVKGIPLIESILKRFSYAPTKRKIERRVMTQGHGHLNPTRTYFRAVEPKSVRMFIKDISDPAQFGLGTREVRRARFAKVQEIAQSKDPKVRAKMRAEKEFNKKYYNLLDEMYASDFTPAFKAQQKKYRKKKLVRDVAKAGITTGVGAGGYIAYDELQKNADRKKKKQPINKLLSDLFNRPSTEMFARQAAVLGSSVLGGLLGGKFGGHYGFGGRLTGAIVGATGLGVGSHQVIGK